MAKKSILIAVIIGIILGAIGTYYSNYALEYLGISELTLPSTYEPESKIEQVPSLPLTLLTNELQYSLLEVKETEFGVNGEKPLEGGIFLITKIEIENLGKQEVIVFGKNWQLIDENKRIYTPKTFDTLEDEEKIFSIRIPPGFKVTKTIGFEIPSNLNFPREIYVADRGFDSQPALLGII